ncbi:adenylate/guanylate cyclase domain-containing protein [Desulfuromonas acetoxidans]|uniref:Guanylate cyclase domain-containing protein n=1 Tax=Desulfuromonas acetoxidans (strain DSM 684 / 11070) TaxID=281689 RepID=Q1K2Z4_DESA6|nr:hypothetical protein [Desulfuromonas acetoxidans]EAT16737.1 conserved hypothetical protein [Desulfuromonas acetoxidans DSM 684]NVD23677.1 adenylate/guanylate cyclase domain-containing protein [Desulfuromonas acetoxidans]NVE15938.1 adenylate/guanylate cyclase domain-containing protein [Desulfuromonas acetoxidans]
MEAGFRSFDYQRSIERIDEILNSSDSLYEDKEEIPSRGLLTFNNGYYVKCSALFVDMRGSKELNSGKHTRPVLAKIFKTYISELVALLKDHSGVSEVYIEGDCVWGIYNTTKKKDIDNLFSVAARVSSLVDILNIKYRKKNYSEISVGVGLDYGSSFLIKAGHKGTGVNEVVWLGELVGRAAQLCSYGNQSSGDKEIMVSNAFYLNLNNHNKGLLEKNEFRNCYHGNVINKTMDKWVKDNG